MKRFRREVALVLEGGPYGENVVRINFLDLPWGLGLLASKQDEIFIDEVINVFFCTMFIWKDASLFCSYKVLI